MIKYIYFLVSILWSEAHGADGHLVEDNIDQVTCATLYQRESKQPSIQRGTVPHNIYWTRTENEAGTSKPPHWGVVLGTMAISIAWGMSTVQLSLAQSVAISAAAVILFKASTYAYDRYTNTSSDSLSDVRLAFYLTVTLAVFMDLMDRIRWTSAHAGDMWRQVNYKITDCWWRASERGWVCEPR